MKNSNDTVGNRTRNLPTCSAVPQPTAPPRAPDVRNGEHQNLYAVRGMYFLWSFDPVRVMAFPYRAWRLQYLDTPHLVGLLWATDRPFTETST